MQLKYLAGLKPIEGGRGFDVIVPDFPEIATFGDTLVDAVAMARDAVELVIEDMSAAGETLAPPRDMVAVWSALIDLGYTPHLVEVEIEEASERFNISMTPSLMARVDRAATAEGVSRSAFIQNAVKQAMAARSSAAEATGVRIQAQSGQATVEGPEVKYVGREGAIYTHYGMKPPGNQNPYATGKHTGDSGSRKNQRGEHKRPKG